MRIKAYLSTVSCFFLVVAIFHFVRAINQTKVLIGKVEIPLWISWVAMFVAFYLAYQAWKLRS